MSEHAPAPPPPLIPHLVLELCLGCLSATAVLVNCALLIIILIKRLKNGMFAIITQMIVADLLLLSTAIWPEMWSTNIGTWSFGYYGCLAHRGLNAFASTASVYLIASIAFHSLALINLEEKNTVLKIKRFNYKEDDELRSSRRSLVTSSDSSTPPRNINLDYRLHRKVSVYLPMIFLWILAASLSVPEFTLANAVNVKYDIVQCSLIETNTPFHMYWMFAVGNIALSFVILISAAILIGFKLMSEKIISTNLECELYAGLKLALWLIFVYFILCAPRLVINIYRAYSALILTNTAQPEGSVVSDNTIMVALSLVFGLTYLISAILRPVLCIVHMPQVLNNFNSNSSCNADKV